MRILHLIRSFGYGGAENHVRDIANVLDELGHTVFIMAKRGNQNDLLNPGVRFIETTMTDINVFPKAFTVARFARNNKIDIIHVHQRLPVFIGTVARRLTGIPVVVTVHGKTQYDIRSPFIRKHIDRFIFVRQSTYDEAAGYGIPPEKSIIIQNGVRVTYTSEKRDHYSLCYISRIDKRHSSVISSIMNEGLSDLFGRIPGIRFNIVGDGDNLEELRKEADSINGRLGSEVVILHGYMPDVMKIIRKSGLVFGVGRVAIETLACGVPVLSVNQKYFGGLVSRDNYDFFRKNNFVGYGLEPPDGKKLGAELEKYFSHIDYWQDEAAYLRKRIDEDFNIYKIISFVTDIYSELAGRGGKSC
jgi:glycosyltransferase involved in cell wall biosynthesis